MSKPIAVILSGCGRKDGSEASETILTLLALDKAGYRYVCLAPNMEVPVVNHRTGETMPNQMRNTLVEAARLPHVPVQDLAEANPLDYSALIFPGGSGAGTHLCDFMQKRGEATVLPVVRTWVEAMIAAKRPVGFICIAPGMMPLLYPEGVWMTLGGSEEIEAAAGQMGAEILPCSATDIVADPRYRVASTPAYIATESIAEVAQGIEKLVHQIGEWIAD